MDASPLESRPALLGARFPLPCCWNGATYVLLCFLSGLLAARVHMRVLVSVENQSSGPFGFVIGDKYHT